MEEADFPRGGATGLSGLEYRELTRKARKDALFETSDPEAKKKPKKRRSESEDAAKAKTKRRPNVIKAPPKSIRQLTFKVCMCARAYVKQRHRFPPHYPPHIYLHSIRPLVHPGYKQNNLQPPSHTTSSFSPALLFCPANVTAASPLPTPDAAVDGGNDSPGRDTRDYRLPADAVPA